MISVVLLGAGNVGTHLYRAFQKSSDVTVLQWYNRSIERISSFKNEVDITDDLSALVEADIYMIAVSDGHIAAIAKALPFKGRLIVHTSGSLHFRFLGLNNRRAVFYPLQTFTTSREIDFSQVPICIESTNKKDIETLIHLSDAMGCKHYLIDSEQRLIIHLAAVFVNNFTNQLYRIAHELSDAKNIEFEMLKPLIMETALKVQDMSPYLAQTGPAKRGDKNTIKRHLNLLEKPKHKAIYQLLTDAIKQTHGNKKL